MRVREGARVMRETFGDINTTTETLQHNRHDEALQSRSSSALNPTMHIPTNPPPKRRHTSLLNNLMPSP